MNIKFKKVHLSNFLSFDDAIIELSDGGYILVRGRNENPDDLAYSNGSGKSSIWEGISWALTGDTIRGSKSVVNLNGSDGALVELEFEVNSHNYVVLRTKDHSLYKTTLKVIVDGEDKSGKGIRDTEKLLAEYLPDLTPQLIGSVIILGQGLPQRFTNNSPSGRKEVLEKLSKSDFMISDLKDRILTRKSVLSQELRCIQDTLLQLRTELKLNTQQLEDVQKSLNELNGKTNLQSRIETLSTEISVAENSAAMDSAALEGLEVSLLTYQQSVNKKLTEVTDMKSKITSQYDTQIKDSEVAKIGIDTELKTLKREIAQLESITDTCPTCGQKLPDVHKPDTTLQKARVERLARTSEDLSMKITQLKTSKINELDQLQTAYQEEISQLDLSFSKEHALKQQYSTELKSLQQQLTSLKAERVKLETENNNLEALKRETATKLELLNVKIEELSNSILYNDAKQEDTTRHLEVINKMSTIITRDFRGYLLANVIEFINNKAKEYAYEVFGTGKINFTLEGNNISISYDNKEYESLSGGEKQKVDLIVQFALRNMLCKFLNFSSNIIVLDELFDNLDSLGCQKVLNLISTQLNDVDSIFIITHHNDIPIPADRELTIIKGVDKMSRVS